MEKTLGGDRLGAGKKMRVELHNYERSTHDLGYLWRSTMSAGTLVPFMHEIALPGDTFDINLDCDIKTHPTIGPLFGSYKVQLDVFYTPLRLYNSILHNNTLRVGLNMSQVKLPLIRMTALQQDLSTVEDIDNSQVNPSSLLAYLGIRGIGNTANLANRTRDFNAVGILEYWDIYKNYYANKQEEIGVVIHTPSLTITENVTDFKVNTLSLSQAPAISSRQLTEGSFITIDHTAGTTPELSWYVIRTNAGYYTADQLFYNQTTVTATQQRADYDYNTHGDLNALNWDYVSASTPRTGEPELYPFDLNNIDTMRRAVLALWNTNTPLVINDEDLEPYKFLYQQPDGIPNILSSQEGLGVKTYQSDLLNNWLNTTNIEAVATATAISTAGASFTIDQLIMSSKLYKLLNRINVSGGSYDDWIDAAWAHEGHRRTENPAYMGGLIKELVFQEVISNTEAPNGQPLGTLAGRGIMGNKHKGGTVVVKVDEPGYIMGIISLTPRIDYSQGNKWDVNLRTLDDLHKPQLDEIGFQDLITERMAWWNTQHNGTTWVTPAVGKQPAWVDYMTNVNRTYGNFAIPSNEMFMTLNRRYETADGITINDLTTYIDPAKFNFIFAQTALDAQNFWVQIAVDITARRKMSHKIMPNL